MKKTISFLIFVAFFAAGTFLSNSWFASPVNGYISREALLVIAMGMYLITVWNKTELLDVTVENLFKDETYLILDIPVILVIRICSSIALLASICMFAFSLISIGDSILGVEYQWLYSGIFCTIVFNAFLTQFLFIACSNSKKEPKKKESKE